MYCTLENYFRMADPLYSHYFNEIGGVSQKHCIKISINGTSIVRKSNIKYWALGNQILPIFRLIIYVVESTIHSCATNIYRQLGNIICEVLPAWSSPRGFIERAIFVHLNAWGVLVFILANQEKAHAGRQEFKKLEKRGVRVVHIRV